MNFPVDILTTADPESLEQSARDYMSELLSKNPEKHEFLSLPESKTINFENFPMSFVPLYGADIKQKVLAVFSPEDTYKAIGLYLNGQWWSAEDILRTEDPSRTGLVEVRTLGERIVLYVLNRIIYRTKEMAKDDVFFLCHDEDEIAKILWKDGEAIGFYSVKPEGSLCSNLLNHCYHLPVMETVFVRKSHRGKGHGLQMLEDFIDSFRKNYMGLKHPLSASMYNVCKKYFSAHPADKDLLWEVEGAGGPFRRTQIAKKLQTMELTGKHHEQIMCKLTFDTKDTDAPVEEKIAQVKDTVEYTETVEEVVQIKTTKEKNETLGTLCAKCSNLKHKVQEDTDVTLEGISEITQLDLKKTKVSLPTTQSATALEKEKNVQIISVMEIQSLGGNEGTEIVKSLDTNTDQEDLQPFEIHQVVEMEIVKMTSQTEEAKVNDSGDVEVDPKTTGEMIQSWNYEDQTDMIETTSTYQDVAPDKKELDKADDKLNAVSELVESKELDTAQILHSTRRRNRRSNYLTPVRHSKRLQDQSPEGKPTQIVLRSITKHVGTASRKFNLRKTNGVKQQLMSPRQTKVVKLLKEAKQTTVEPEGEQKNEAVKDCLQEENIGDADFQDAKQVKRTPEKVDKATNKSDETIFVNVLEGKNVRSAKKKVKQKVAQHSAEATEIVSAETLKNQPENEPVEEMVSADDAVAEEMESMIVTSAENMKAAEQPAGEPGERYEEDKATKMMQVEDGDRDVESTLTGKGKTEVVQEKGHVKESTGKYSGRQRSTHQTPGRRSKRVHDQPPEGELAKRVLTSSTKASEIAFKQISLTKKHQNIYHKHTKDTSLQKETQQSIQKSEFEKIKSSSITTAEHNKNVEMTEAVDTTNISSNKKPTELKKDVITLESASGNSTVQETSNKTIRSSKVAHDHNKVVQAEMHDGKKREEAVTKTALDDNTSIVKLPKAAVVLVDCSKQKDTNKTSKITQSLELLTRSETATEEIAFSELKEQEPITETTTQETVELGENNTQMDTEPKQDFVTMTVTNKSDLYKKQKKDKKFSQRSTVQKSTTEEDTPDVMNRSLRQRTPKKSTGVQKTHPPKDTKDPDAHSETNVDENKTVLTHSNSTKGDMHTKNVEATNEVAFNMYIQQDKLINQELKQTQDKNISVQEEDEQIATCIAKHSVEVDDRQSMGEVAAMKNTVNDRTLVRNVTSSALESPEEEISADTEVTLVTKHLRTRIVTATSPSPKKSQRLSRQVLEPHVMTIQAQISEASCEKGAERKTERTRTPVKQKNNIKGNETSSKDNEKKQELEREQSVTSDKQQRTNISKGKAKKIEEIVKRKHMLLEGADSMGAKTAKGKSYNETLLDQSEKTLQEKEPALKHVKERENEPVKEIISADDAVAEEVESESVIVTSEENMGVKGGRKPITEGPKEITTKKIEIEKSVLLKDGDRNLELTLIDKEKTDVVQEKELVKESTGKSSGRQKSTYQTSARRSKRLHDQPPEGELAKDTNKTSKITQSLELLTRSETATEEIAFSELKEQEPITETTTQETVELGENNTQMDTEPKQDFVAMTVTNKSDSYKKLKKDKKHSTFSQRSTVQKSTTEEDTPDVMNRSLRPRTPKKSTGVQKTHPPKDTKDPDAHIETNVDKNKTVSTHSNSTKGDMHTKNVEATNEVAFNMFIQQDKLINQELKQTQSTEQVKEVENRENNQTTGIKITLPSKNIIVQEEDEQIATCIAEHSVEVDDRQPKGEVVAMRNTVNNRTLVKNVTSSALESSEEEIPAETEVTVVTKHLRTRIVMATSPSPKKSQQLSRQVLEPHVMKIQAQTSEAFCEKGAGRKTERTRTPVKQKNKIKGNETSSKDNENEQEVEREQSVTSDKQQRTNISKGKAKKMEEIVKEKCMLIEGVDSKRLETIHGKSDKKILVDQSEKTKKTFVKETQPEEKDNEGPTTSKILEQVEDAISDKVRAVQKRKSTVLIQVTSEMKSKRHCIEHQEETSSQVVVESTGEDVGGQAKLNECTHTKMVLREEEDEMRTDKKTESGDLVDDDFF